MGRLGIYVKDKIEQEIRDIVQMDLQNGALQKDVSISSTCNELLRMGLIMHKAKSSEDTFNKKEWQKDVIRKISGSREGIILLITMVTEIWMKTSGNNGGNNIDDLLTSYLAEIDRAEQEADNRHFVTDATGE